VDPTRYLEDEVLTSAVSDIVEVAAYHARHHARNTGHFSTPRQVFCYADHLGYIAYGETASTARTVRFIREFFPPNYGRFAELLVAMWRHGTVHQLRPYSYRAPLHDGDVREPEVRWLSSNHNRKKERAQHMLVFSMENTPDAVYLVVNSCQLADDLVYSVNRLIGALGDGTVDVADCAARVGALQQSRRYDDGVGRTMAAALAAQIRDAWSAQGGMLSESGNVVLRHPDASL
jgi:hypothetical protein